MSDSLLVDRRATPLERVWRVLRWRPVTFLIVIAVGAAVVNLYLSLAAVGKVDDELAQAAKTQPTVAVVVELGFAPEEFHLQELQAYGTVGSVEGQQINLLQVDAADVEQIAREYWVQELHHGEQ